MKKISFIGLIIILSIGFLYNPSAQTTKNINKQEPEEEILLLNAMEAGGFKIEEFNINMSTFASNTFLTIEELEIRQKEIMKVLNISGETIAINMDNMYDPSQQDYFEDLLETSEDLMLEQRVEDDGYKEIITLAPDQDGNMTVIKLLSTQIEGDLETHIIVDIVQNKGYKEVVDISNQIEKLLDKYGDKVETTINLKGFQLGSLGRADEKKSQEAVFSFLKAKKIEVLEDEFFTSITAHSPLINSHISYDGKDVNIQLAMRYSEYEDKTYLWLGTPLITTTY